MNPPTPELEGQIEILKLQLHNLELRLGYLESNFPKLRDRFAGFKGQMDAIQAEIPTMRATFQKKVGAMDSIEKKVEELYSITVKKYNEDHPNTKIKD